MQKLFFLIIISGGLLMAFWKIVTPYTSDDVNYHTNPSLEFGTTGYSTGGTNTIAISTEQQWRGRYSLKCTRNNNAKLALYTGIVLPTANTTYYHHVRLYVPSNWAINK